MRLLEATIVFFAAVSAYCLFAACGSPMVDKTAIAADGVVIALCQAQVKICRDTDGGAGKCWDVYDSCMSVHGLTDGGK